MGKPPKAKRYRPAKWEPAFLAALAEQPNVARAARIANTQRTNVYMRRHAHPEFEAGFQAALRLGIATAEDKAWELSLEGWLEPVWYRDREVGSILKRDHGLLQFMLRAHAPEVYSDRYREEELQRREVEARRAGSVEAQRQVAALLRSLPAEMTLAELRERLEGGGDAGDR